jgi:hypothetical protein
MSFRNYTPANEALKDQESKITTPADIGDTIEKKMEGVVERVIQEEDEKRAKDVVSLLPSLSLHLSRGKLDTITEQ